MISVPSLHDKNPPKIHHLLTTPSPSFFKQVDTGAVDEENSSYVYYSKKYVAHLELDYNKDRGVALLLALARRW